MEEEKPDFFSYKTFGKMNKMSSHSENKRSPKVNKVSMTSLVQNLLLEALNQPY
jgi:hypothetical protein